MFKVAVIVALISAVVSLHGAELVSAKESVLYSFCVEDRSCADGAFPWARVVLDGSGNLYGTTMLGGAYGLGMVFQLTPNPSGTWTQKVLHTFSGPDGAEPQSNLLFDAAGNLYGTTFYGGDTFGSGCGGSGCGTVFRLERSKDGSWTEKMLYNFCSLSNCADGAGPWGAVVLDASGNLYGTAYQGGTNNYGLVFELHPKGNDGWAEQVLHQFDRNGTDGIWPRAALILDSSGTLYGTTPFGGQHDSGIAFSLHLAKNGNWQETVLHSFGNGGTDGGIPLAPLLLGPNGSLYGTTQSGGSSGFGNVFLLEQRGNTWTAKVLHSFNGRDGILTHAGLISDAHGSLYGASGGGTYGAGLVLKLIHGSKGRWHEKVIYSFRDNGKDGLGPETGLIFDSVGNLYGTTVWGGASGHGCEGDGWGAISKITP